MMRRRPCSPSSSAPAPAPPLEDENLLSEILLRLPPQPSTLPRASVVCTRWLRVVADPGFLRRFRAYHRKAPLLGFFSAGRNIVFSPTLDPPDRIPAARFSPPRGPGEHLHLHDCRHGRALALRLNRGDRGALEAVVWDPITGHQRPVPFPPGFEEMVVSAAVLPAAGGDHAHAHGDCDLNPFKLALVRMDCDCTRALVCLYESESGAWGDIMSTAVTDCVNPRVPSVLIGNALFWLLYDGGILEFDIEKQSLVVIEYPEGAHATHETMFQTLRTEDSRLGLAMLTGWRIEVWERKVNSCGIFSWVFGKTVRLDKLLSPGLSMQSTHIEILGYVEDRNAIVLWKDGSVFMIQLDSMEVKNLFQGDWATTYYPYTSFYPAGKPIGGRDDGPEMLNNT